MKLPGYCTRCRRLRRVTVAAQELAFVAVGISSVPQGVCDECAEQRPAPAAIPRERRP